MMFTAHDNLGVFGNNLPVGIALFDAELRLMRHNRRWLAYLHTTSETLAGQTLWQLLPDAEATLAPFIAQALQGERIEDEEIRLMLNDNIAYWDVTLSPQIEEGNHIIGILLIASDVTERELANQLLERRAQDRTRKLQAIYDVTTVAAAESHDMNTLLNACLPKVMGAIHAIGGAIHLLDEHDKFLVLRATLDVKPQILAILESLEAKPIFSTESPIDNTVTLPSLGDQHIYAAVPMYANDRIMGVLTMLRERSREFSLEDVALLSSMGDQIGILIDNFHLRSENERLLLIQERSRLARELHDAVTQSLYSLMLFAGATKRQAQQGELENVLQYVGRLETTAQQALKEMRLLLHNLRPAILAEVGLIRALRQRLDAVEGRANIRFQLLTDSNILLPTSLEEALYFIASEALNNSLKHAQANHVILHFDQTETHIEMEVTDNGNGFDPRELTDSGGLGLISMKERAEKLGGWMSVNSAENQGTTIQIKIPLKKL